MTLLGLFIEGFVDTSMVHAMAWILIGSGGCHTSYNVYNACTGTPGYLTMMFSKSGFLTMSQSHRALFS